MGKDFKVGDKYWTFYTDAEIWGHVWWPPIELRQFEVKLEYEIDLDEQEYYFASKNDAIDWVVSHFESMREG